MTNTNGDKSGGSSLVRELLGRRVYVHTIGSGASGTGGSDGREEGSLEGFDGTLLKVKGENLRGGEEFLYIPLVSIRVIKPVVESGVRRPNLLDLPDLG